MVYDSDTVLDPSGCRLCFEFLVFSKGFQAATQTMQFSSNTLLGKFSPRRNGQIEKAFLLVFIQVVLGAFY
jgi:hypothetical protein